ncbi:MAG: UDP-galactopyranose mutase [Planctomycetota bacterium]|jgi:UDP-galactopyranose mutase
MKVDLLVVGAGFSGAVIAERAASQLGMRVLLIERRNHIGGNAHDCFDEYGVRVHKYGPHVFHTNNTKVWKYLSQFTRWRLYNHHVLAMVRGRAVPVPFNLTSLSRLFHAPDAHRLIDALVCEYGFGGAVPILRLRQSGDRRIRSLADFVYEHLYLGYTIKQWGLPPEQLDPSVTGRVPVRISYDNRYFLDRYQGLPHDGYSSLFWRLLDHPLVEVMLDTDYQDVAKQIRHTYLVYTGPIDRFFEYQHGPLPYRNVRFEFRHLNQEVFQPTGAVHHPNTFDYTRVCEFKHLTGQRITGTTVAYEFHQPYRPGQSDPYYPIPRPDNNAVLNRYVADAARLRNVTFCGRLANYRYLNMDQAVGRALMAFERAIVPAMA